MIGLIFEFVLQHPLSLYFEEVATVVFYFTLYSFLGWLLENSYNFITEREFFKANFFRGPFKPMYGFAPVLLIYSLPQNSDWVKMLLLCFFIPTFIEYVSGHLLQKFSHRKWWDYSSHAIHINGHICLTFSLCWILLSFLCINYIQPVIVSVYRTVESVWILAWPVIILYFLAELALAIRRHSSQNLLTEEQSNPIQ